MGGASRRCNTTTLNVILLTRWNRTCELSGSLFLELSWCPRGAGDLRRRHSQVGSLAGAAHLLNDNTGVLR